MPFQSDAQRRMIFAIRDKYGSESKTPEKYKWVWSKDWEKKESLTKQVEQAESYQSFFYKLREDYGTLETIIGNLTREYPITKLWVEEKTFGIIVRAIVVDPEHREKGIGTEAIKRILEYADDVNKPVALTPSKQYGGYMNRLVAWAKALGFVYNKGKTKDYRLPETMIRFPQKRGIADVEEG